MSVVSCQWSVVSGNAFSAQPAGWHALNMDVKGVIFGAKAHQFISAPPRPSRPCSGRAPPDN